MDGGKVNWTPRRPMRGMGIHQTGWIELNRIVVQELLDGIGTDLGDTTGAGRSTGLTGWNAGRLFR